MARYIQEGKIINYRNTTAETIHFGDEVVLTDRIGVASADIESEILGTVALDGVFEFASETGTAFTVGQTVYWDSANHRVTATKAESGAILAGMVVAPKASAEGNVLVKL